MKLYGFYRPETIGTKNLWEISQNGTYSMSFYANGQYADWVSVGLISIKDMEISENQYTKELVPWIKDGRRFVYLEYNENYIDEATATEVVNKIGARFDLVLLTREEALAFIREHTSLVEESEWVFVISEEQDDIDGVIPKKTLELN